MSSLNGRHTKNVKPALIMADDQFRETGKIDVVLYRKPACIIPF